MATVFIPTMLQPMTGGVKQFDCDASNLRQVIERLDQMFPGIKDKLVEDGRIKPNLAVAIDGEVARMGLLEKVGENSEVHFVPAIGGGSLGTLNIQSQPSHSGAVEYPAITDGDLTFGKSY